MGEAAGSVVTAPRSGKRVRYLETAAETDGEYARFEMWLAPPPSSHGPMRHVHPEQEEYLAVREGRLGLWHDGDVRELTAGESVIIPAGDPHRFWNAGDGALRLAPVLDEYDDLLYLAALPVAVQRVGVLLFAMLGRALGYDADYPEYVPAERRAALVAD
jgi:quercetin dioxygenase-like cupin family protein